MIRLTASGMKRAELCPASASLPRTETLHADAQAGTAAHAVREAREDRPGYRSEVAFAYNCLTGEARELPRQAHRAYPDLGEAWIYCTVDTVAVLPDCVVVLDFKSGAAYGVEAASRNIQLGIGAVCASIAHGRECADVGIEFADGRPPDMHHLDGMALMAAEERIRRIYAACAAPEPRVVESDAACWRCPAYSRCPAKTTLAVAMAEGVDLRNFPTLELTPESVARGWVALKNAKKVLGEVERVYRGYAAGNPVTLPEGKTLGEVEKSRESIDGHKAYTVLAEKYGETVALLACEVEATKASIERAVKPLADKGKGAQLVRETLAAIGAAGGITTKITTVVEER